MTFNKPQNVTLTQMAQWVDSHEIADISDQNKQVEYLYHLVLCRAKQLSLFNDSDTYDDFCIYCVSKLLIRLNNRKEAPVKSIVNYIRTVINHWYAEYVSAFCSGAPEVNTEFDVTDFSDYLIDASSEGEHRTLFYDGCCITSAINKHLKNIPKRKNSPEWQNICISCYLTLEDRVSSAKSLTMQLMDIKSEQLLNRLVRGLKNRPPILFNIDKSLSGYISVLVNELTHVIAVELTDSIGASVSATDCLQSLVAAAYNTEED